MQSYYTNIAWAWCWCALFLRKWDFEDGPFDIFDDEDDEYEIFLFLILAAAAAQAIGQS